MDRQTDPTQTAVLQSQAASNRRLSRFQLDALIELVVATAVALTAFSAKGGLQVARVTSFEIAAVVIGGLFLAIAVLFRVHTDQEWGKGTFVLFGAFTLFTGLSVLWSVQPADSWLEFNRTLAYFFVFASGFAAVKFAPSSWRALLGGILIGVAVISLYALLTKILPGVLAKSETFVRAREPYSYWNAVGLTAATGVPLALWIGTCHQKHRLIRAASYPLTALFVTTVLLTISRGSLLALLVGVGIWFAMSQQRLRSLAIALFGGVGGSLVALWAYSQDALANEHVALSDRITAGQKLGVLFAVVVILVYVIGVGIDALVKKRGFTNAQKHLVGKVTVGAIGLALVAGLIAVSVSSKGPIDRISDSWHTLTNEDAATPNTGPKRLTATSSVRARYWHEAIKIYKTNKLVGSGAGGYATARKRFRKDTLDVRHAHGYIAQTLSDLGLVGLGLSLALLVTFSLATVRTLGIRRRKERPPYSPERAGFIAMFVCVVVFGVHSLIDWTWFIPGTAIPALLFASYLVGRGPVTRAVADGRITKPAKLRTGLAVGIVSVAALTCWSIWLPLSSYRNDSKARELSSQKRFAEAADFAEKAKNSNPLSVEPLFTLATISQVRGNNIAANDYLQEAVKLQPANTDTWERLAEFQIEELKNPNLAFTTLRAALFLDSRSRKVQSQFVVIRTVLIQQAKTKRIQEQLKREEAERRKRSKKRKKQKLKAQTQQTTTTAPATGKNP